MTESTFLERSMSADTPLPAEFRAMMGVYLLYMKLADRLDCMEIDPPLAETERHVLIKLDRPTRMGDLAREMQVPPSSLTSLADTLETKGFITRERDPKDRRAWRLTLTPEGQELRALLIERGSALFREVSGLSAPKIEEFAELAGHIACNIMKTGLPKGSQK